MDSGTHFPPRAAVDVVYVAWNRLAFTRFSFAQLIANTDWAHAARLVVYDDGSTDGTREWLEAAAMTAASAPTVEFRKTSVRSPVAIMLDFLRHDPDAAPVFAKIDNDCVVPPGWLPAMRSVLDRHPDVELLGMEAGMTAVPGRDGVPFDGSFGFEPATNIGGIGLMRTSCFRRLPSMKADGRNGFSELQHTYNPTRGWIAPDLPVVLLDRVPVEPWLTLSRAYIEQGWQRPQGIWDPHWMQWAWEWLPEQVAA